MHDVCASGPLSLPSEEYVPRPAIYYFLVLPLDVSYLADITCISTCTEFHVSILYIAYREPCLLTFKTLLCLNDVAMLRSLLPGSEIDTGEREGYEREPLRNTYFGTNEAHPARYLEHTVLSYES